MMKFLSVLFLLIFLLLCGNVVTAAEFQTLTVESVEKRIHQLETDEQISAESQSALIGIYQKALTSVQATELARKQQSIFAQALEKDNLGAQNIRQDIDLLALQPDVGDEQELAKNTLEGLTQKLAVVKSDRAAAESRLTQLEKQRESESKRPEKIHGLLTDNKKELQILLGDLQRLPPGSSQGDVQAEAFLWQQQARRAELEQQIKTLNQELLSHPAHLKFIKLSLEKARLVNDQVAIKIRRMEKVLNSLRLQKVEQVSAQDVATEAAAATKAPVLRKVAEENLQISNQLTKVTEKTAAISTREGDAREQLRMLEADFHQTRQKLEIAGVSQAVGQLMLEQQRNLPDVRQYQKQMRRTESIMAETGLRQIGVSEKRRALRDLDQTVSELTQDMPADAVVIIEDELRELLSRKRDLLDKLVAGDGDYLQALTELDFAQRQLQDVIESYQQYLQEQLLWVRSTPAVSTLDISAAPTDFANLFALNNWQQLLRDLTYHATKVPLFIFLLLTIFVLLYYTPKLKRAVVASGEQVGKPMSDHFSVTLIGIGWSLLLALPLPLLIFGTASLIKLSPDTAAFSRDFAAALRWVLLAAFALIAFRVMCMKKGVFEQHFSWQPELLKNIRREVSWMLVLFLPLMVMVAVSGSVLPHGETGVVIKVFLLSALWVLGRFLYRMLNPSTGLIKEFLQQNKKSMLNKSRWIWVPLIFLVPLGLSVLVLLGYLYAAGGLMNYLIDTMVLVLVLVIIYELAERWLLMTQRKLAYQSAIERHQALQKSKQVASNLDEEETVKESDEPKVDFVALSSESRTLLQAILLVAAAVGLWLIWASALPAFNIFDQWVLWHHTDVVAGVAQQVPVTLEDLMFALLIVFASVIAARNLPSLVEIILLQQFAMSAGSRYTVRTITGYIIAAIGVLATLNVIGGSWSQVQWLVAALSVGIGFGLQEIVANFISGLIILFERPIRVGDYVTVGNTDGTVTRIQIRATTIQTRDNKELLMPNKEFITGQLLNWSLTDRVTRLIVPVGIAYGNDVDKAMALMHTAAQECEWVLTEPDPVVHFNSFGDSALLLELRCFIASVEHRINALTDLNLAINHKFIAAGIEIPFPQRDVHLDTAHPIDVRLQPHPGI